MTKVEFKTTEEKINDLCEKIRNVDPFFNAFSDGRIVEMALESLLKELE